MGFKLRVFFEGVFAFVPSEPFFYRDSGKWKEGNPKWAWVLVPRLAGPDLADWDRGASAHAPYDLHYRAHHHPMMSVERRHVRWSDRVRDPFQLEVSPFARPSLVRTLQTDRLVVTDGGDELAGDLTCEVTIPEPGRRHKPSADHPEEWRSLWWVPQLEVVRPGHSTIRKENNPTDGDFVFGESALDAVLFLDGGTLSVADFNREGPNGPPRVWPFAGVTRNPDGTLKPEDEATRTWNRAIGNTLLWEVDIESRYAGVHHGDESQRELRVRPTCFGKRVVEIHITNLEPERYMVHGRNTPYPFPVLWDEDRDTPLPFDPDFQVLYQLTTGAGTRRYPYNPTPQGGRYGRPCSGGSGAFA